MLGRQSRSFRVQSDWTICLLSARWGIACMQLGEMFTAIRSDWAANAGNPKSQLVLLGFRVAAYFASKRDTAIVIWLLGLPAMISYRVCVEWFLGIEIPAKTRVEPGLRLYHGQGLVVHPATTIGAGAILRHNTTIGVKSLEKGSLDAPIIGAGVDVGSNSVVIGHVRVGDHAVIGAGSVVLHDVEPGAVVAGNPARPIRG